MIEVTFPKIAAKVSSPLPPSLPGVQLQLVAWKAQTWPCQTARQLQPYGHPAGSMAWPRQWLIAALVEAGGTAPRHGGLRQHPPADLVDKNPQAALKQVRSAQGMRCLGGPICPHNQCHVLHSGLQRVLTVGSQRLQGFHGMCLFAQLCQV